MRKLVLLLNIFLLTTAITLPQWTNQNPVPEGNHLWSTFFITDNTGWIVGSDGFIRKTANGGLDWFEQNGGTSSTLRSVQFINENTGWICGENGLIIKTTDGGANWFGLSSGTTENLTDIHFIDSNIGYVVGYNETILKTSDGGSSWSTQNTGSDFDIYSVDFVDAILGYAVGGRDSSNFLKTTDGGLSWIKKTLSLGNISTPILNCVEFTNSNTGYIGSEGQFLNHSGNISKTTDGGITWFSTTLWRAIQKGDQSEHYTEDNPTDNQRGIRSIYFKDQNSGFAVGGTRDGWWRSIFTTTDAGATWENKYGYSEQTGLLSVFVNGNGKGLAVGYSGIIYTTENYGSSWFQILSGKNSLYYAGDWITSVFMINENVGWAAGYRKGIWYYPIILKTTNGGKSWITNSEFGNSFTKSSTNIFFINENSGWVSFYDRNAYKTTDGGLTWFTSGISGNSIFFINQDTGLAAYEPLGIYKSTNGGTNWTKKSSVSSRSIFFADINNGWAVGNSGSILKSTDEGESWISKTSGTTSNLNSVHFYNNNVGMSVGKYGTALLSTDGGENWVSQIIGTSSTLNSVRVTSQNTVWIVGNDGTVISSDDQGTNWISHSGLTESNLSSVHFLNENTGWIAGDNSIIKYFVEPAPPTIHFAPVWSGSGYMVMDIYVTGVELIGGGSLIAGDEIAVFDGERCVGAVLLTEPIPVGGNIIIKASTDDPGTPIIDGFINGNPISYKFWLSSISQEVSEYTANYISGSGVFVSLGSATVEFANVVPVEFISFKANVSGNKVVLNWQTATEVNNYGFEIERSSDKNNWIILGFVNGSGNREAPKDYTFIDDNLIGGNKFYYRLKQTDNDGSFVYSDIIEVDALPVSYSLYQNYPNPFNPSTTIRYQLPNEAKVIVKLYDMLGNEVSTLVNEVKQPGVYEVELNAQDLASGTYIYRLVSGGFTETRKMVLLK
ncbi:MAG: T9SS type A sorting domain-containing protein [bacterium]|nr:T9SS type A sorting domain-containing protein [bacterium]